QIELRALQLEADADRSLYNRLLTRLKETSIESGLQLPDAKVISPAEAPVTPTFPKLGMILPIVFVSSCLFAGLVAIMMEAFDHGYWALEELEQNLGVPAIGIVPTVKRRARGRKSPEVEVVEHPAAAMAETIRGLYTSLILSSLDRPPKSVLFASALSHEG